MHTMISTKNREYLDKSIQDIFNSKNKGDIGEAIRKAKLLADELPTDPAVCGVLASLYFQVDKFDESAVFFKKAVDLSPASEVASLGLFHSLWSIGKKEEALKEMRRYLEISESEEYKNLLSEISENPGA